MFLARKIFMKLPNICIASLRKYRVAVVGCANQIGQTLTLLLRREPSVTRLNIYDTLDHTPGVVLDLAHIPTETVIKGYTGKGTLANAIKKCDLIIASGGVTPMPGLSQKDIIKTNTDFIKSLASEIAHLRPMPFVGILTEPINSLVPIAAEIIRSHGNYDPKKLFGITAIDSLRALTLYAAERNLNPCECILPIIGGHSTKTMIPLLSQAMPPCDMDEKNTHEFIDKVRRAEQFVLEAKKGWSPTLSMAHSGLLFARVILSALDGQLTSTNAFVENNDFGTSFFSGLVFIDKNGAGEMQRYANLSHYECYLLEHSIAQLRRDVWTGRKILEVL